MYTFKSVIRLICCNKLFLIPMSKSSPKRTLRITLIELILILCWFFYNIIGFQWVKEFKVYRTGKALGKNFCEHSTKFDDLKTFSSSFPELNSLYFWEKNQISFQVYDSLYKSNNPNLHFISLGEHQTFEISDIAFLANNTLKITLKDTILNFQNWILDYNGKITDPLVPKLLAYQKIPKEYLPELKQKLSEINCHGFSKNEESITLIYKGDVIRNYSYILPLNMPPERHWNKLQENVYWEYWEHPNICE